MELCEFATSRFFKQSCPDWFLVGSRKVAEDAEEEWLDEDCIDEGAEAGQYCETMSKKDGAKPRVGMAKSDVGQDRGRCCEKNELNIVKHSAMVLIGGVPAIKFNAIDRSDFIRAVRKGQDRKARVISIESSFLR